MSITNIAGEKDFLQKLARTKCLSNMGPVVDGAALVIHVSHQQYACDILVEVRLPETVDELGRAEILPNGRMIIFLQNAANKPIKFRQPEYILTGGLVLPWTVSFEMLANFVRGELGECVKWQVPLGKNVGFESLAEDIVRIIQIAKVILQNS
jgi:hypothetical protein